MISETLTTLSFPFSGEYDKTVRVFVPAHEDGETLPVIYMTDGQNLFEDDAVRYGCMYTREAVRAERELSGKAAIIVGIHNDEGPRQRFNELTPSTIGALDFPPDMPEEIRKTMDPRGEASDDFVVSTLIPEIETRFPVKKGRQNTAFCGCSSGGLFSFFTALSHPDIFGAACCLSPTFMFYRLPDVSEWIRSTVRDEKPFLYFFAGGADPREHVLSQWMEAVVGMLGECYPERMIKKTVKPDQPHRESAWEPEFREFLHIFLTGAITD